MPFNAQTDRPLLEKLLAMDDYIASASAHHWALRLADVPEVLGDLAMLAMASGHISLAECLVARGAKPAPLTSNPLWLSQFRMSYFPSDKSESANIANLLSCLSASACLVSSRSPKQARRSRAEVLAHASANPSVWPCDPNHVFEGKTPLINTWAVNNSRNRWDRPGNRKTPYDQIELHAFQNALIAAGADIHLSTPKHNLLSASIPDFSAPGVPVDFSGFHRALDWSVDRVSCAPLAWVRALQEDAATRYTLKSGFGARAQALLANGVPLISPVDALRVASPLAKAVEMGHLPATRELLACGADPAWQDPLTGQTLLSISFEGKASTLKALDLFPQGSFSAVVNNKVAYRGDTPLHLAVSELCAPMVARCLAEGADPHATNSKGQKPLQAMRRAGTQAQERFDDVLDLMRGAGADMGSDKHTSVLHHAAQLLSETTVKRLLAEGEDPNQLDRHGVSPMEILVTGHQNHVSNYYNAKRGAKQVRVAKVLLDAGVPIDAKFSDGSTALHQALICRSHVLARFLLEQGADIYALDQRGDTPMHVFRRENGFNGSSHNAKDDKMLPQLASAFAEAGADFTRRSRARKLPFADFADLPAMAALIERQNLNIAVPSVKAANSPGPASRTPRL
jgi:ankyrin repeat protein